MSPEDRGTIFLLFVLVVILIMLLNWRITWLVRSIQRRPLHRPSHAAFPAHLRHSSGAVHQVPAWPERED